MITVVSPTAFRINQHALAIQKTRAALPCPSRGLLISPTRPTIAYDGDWEPIPKCWIPRGQWNLAEYSKFMIFGLIDFIDTKFLITVQHDGFAVNRQNWTERFWEYDYIGAPWPTWINASTRVGNGGFSWRSRKWLERSSRPWQSPNFDAPEVYGLEDRYCCDVYLKWYLEAGLRVAPIGVAIHWSYEHPMPQHPEWSVDKSFGFHAFCSQCNEKHRLPNV